MIIEGNTVVFIMTIFVNFIAFIGVFTKLERRLTSLEITLVEAQKTLKTITDNLIGIGLVERRGEK